MSAFTSSIDAELVGRLVVREGVLQLGLPRGVGTEREPGTDIRTVYRRTSSPAMSRTARLTFAVALVQSEPPIRIIRGDSPPM